MHIYPIRAFTDNYIWAIHESSSNRVCVVDPGDSEPVLEYLEEHQLVLDSILITHYHHDHIGGVETLKAQTQCHVYGSKHDDLSFCDTLLDQDNEITIFESLSDTCTFKIFHVPGHTLGHIAYYEPNKQLLFCGDTLFRAGCGRMFEGNPQQFLNSLTKFAMLPKDTQVYCTHEYTLSNLAFAKYIEPDNHHILALIKKCEALRAENKTTLPSTIASELLTNPFLRCNQEHVIRRICELGTVIQSESNSMQASAIFASMRGLKDSF